MYTALYRAYRPEVFDELLGQEHITRILRNQIAMGSTSHAYLFCGTRGTGKTTTARLLAKGLNCLSEGERPCGECSACRAIKEGNFIDVVEIDAASNNSVDNIRELRDSVNYPPAVGRKKVYIIDEVHMLSSGAFNALLKTLEEPPEYVTFILATTEPQKLPATILSRCLRLDFKRIPEPVLIEGMKRICSDVGIEVEDRALRIIAANADGSVRDGLSILDQCISGGEKTVDTEQVLEFLGASGESVFIELTDLVTKRKTAEAIEYLASVLADGKDVRQLIRDWIGHYRNLMMTKFIRDPQATIDLSVENIDRVRAQSSVMELEDISRGIMELSKTADLARFSTQPRILLEVCIVNLCQTAGMTAPRGAAERMSRQVQRQDSRSPRRTQAQPPVRSKPPAQSQMSAQPPAQPQQAQPQPAQPQPAQPKPQPEAPAPAQHEEPEAGLDALDAMIAAAQAANAGNGGPAEAGRTDAQEVPAGFGDPGMDPFDGPTADPFDGPIAEPFDAPVPEQFIDPVPEQFIEPASEQFDAPAPGPDTGAGTQEDLVKLWDEVFADGEQVKGSIYLIRSNGMLTAMDENTFTVTVGNDLHKKQTERNRSLLEDLMEARTGSRRRMQVIVSSAASAEISVEEAAEVASEVLGTTVGIE